MKVDRRKQRTRALLRDALIALILEKGYDAVTVQDITDRANLGRATFYLHYKGGKDELLLSMMAEIQAEIAQQAGPISESDLLVHGQPPSIYAFQRAEENADFFRAILGGAGLAGILTRYRKSSADQIQAQIEPALAAGNTEIPIEIIANFVAGALNALIIWWLENDRPYSAEDMARIFHQLLLTGIQGTTPETTNNKVPRKKVSPNTPK
ncbi:MAG: TetR/AcrR family transcriptional regulator [Chloroflexota bacterium]